MIIDKILILVEEVGEPLIQQKQIIFIIQHFMIGGKLFGIEEKKMNFD